MPSAVQYWGEGAGASVGRWPGAGGARCWSVRGRAGGGAMAAAAEQRGAGLEAAVRGGLRVLRERWMRGTRECGGTAPAPLPDGAEGVSALQTLPVSGARSHSAGRGGDAGWGRRGGRIPKRRIPPRPSSLLDSCVVKPLLSMLFRSTCS